MTLEYCTRLVPGTPFKRPEHGFSYIFMPLSHDLREVDNNGKTHLPRITAEDITANDWTEEQWP